MIDYRKITLTACVLVMAVSYGVVYGNSLQLVTGNTGVQPEKRAIIQTEPTTGLKEYPFIETMPPPVPTADERARGFILFFRPITMPVYPNAKPLAAERAGMLTAFATPGEFEPLNFGIYPLREIKNLRVSISALKNGDRVIPAENIKVQQVLYWNIRYPRYNSTGAYRRMPEFIQEVSVADALPGECLRYWLTVKTPDDAAAGVYNGAVNISADGITQTVELPVCFRVLPYKLKSDPAKKYTVYYNDLHRTEWMGKKGAAWIDQVMERQYKTMRDYGLNTFPVLYLSYDSGSGKLTIPFADTTIRQLRSAGFQPPIPVVGCGIHNIYKNVTGKEMLKHHLTPEPPPEQVYVEIEKGLKEFMTEARAKNYPEMVFCPLDEVDPQSKDIAIRVYKIFHDLGLKTFATKDPKGDTIAAAMAPYVDYWSSIPFSMKYSEVKNDKTHGHWCYPGHNAWEFKDPVIMCKGGRMTYGFGNWRSGYDLYMPWHWGSLNREHLNQKKDSGGNRLEDDGSYTMTTYWECFREGIDDARYVYTLEDAIVKRENTSNPELKKLLPEGRTLLQNLWNSINAQLLYLDSGMWADSEFDARRWELAQITAKILKYPEENQNTAASVIVDTAEKETADAADEQACIIREQIKIGNVQRLALDENSYTAWKAIDKEASLAVDNEMKLNGKGSLRMNIEIDHYLDGEGKKGPYVVGWPRAFREYPRPGVDLAGYEFFSMWLRVESNRNEVANDRTPFYISLRSYLPMQIKDYTMTGELEEWQWHFLLVPMANIMGNTSPDAFKTIRYVQLGISENFFAHGDKLSFYMNDMAFIKLKKPVLNMIDTQKVVLLPCSNIQFKISILGNLKNYTGKLTIRLLNSDNKIAAEESFVPQATVTGALPGKDLKPGDYSLELQLIDGQGAVASSAKVKVRMINGPLML